MKDIEWLKEEVEKLGKETSQNYPHEKTVELPSVLGLIDQLDEPEKLSSQWIKDNQKMWTSGYGVEYYVPANKLYELLVSETTHKPELPVIPGHVAEYIKNEKESEITLEETLEIMRDPDFKEIDIIKKTSEYVENNIVDFTDAYRYGYTVEEKKYWVRNKCGERMLAPFFGRLSDVLVSKDVVLNKGKEEMFTEQEIKDYDERYFAFAVPVEEMEE